MCAVLVILASVVITYELQITLLVIHRCTKAITMGLPGRYLIPPFHVPPYAWTLHNLQSSLYRAEHDVGRCPC